MRQTLNLIDQSQTSIDYAITTFPDGDTHIELYGINRKSACITVICRVCNAQDLYLLLLVCDILKRQSVVFELKILYLMSMRMDRVMEFNRPYNLSVVVSAISAYKPYCVHLYTPHSHISEYLFETQNIQTSIHRVSLHALQVPTDIQAVIFPDESAEAYLKYHIPSTYNVQRFACQKHRDIDTGLIHMDYVPDVSSFNKVCIFDDLVDGGNTIHLVIEKLQQSNPDTEIHIAATHWVNANGIKMLATQKNCILHMTNSYKDWKSTEYCVNTDNIIQTNLLEHV